MADHVQRLTRVFRVSSQTFIDPAPSETPERAFAMLAVGMPALAHYTLDPPIIEGTQMVYVGVRPPAQTKGAARNPSAKGRNAKANAREAMLDNATSRDGLDAWADAPSTAGYDESLHRAVAKTMIGFARRSPGKANPFVLAMP